MESVEQRRIAWFPIGLTAAFSSLEAVNILHHAMWRDELQVWMIARHSHSIAELISLKKYEGHPDAWFLLVYLITRITSHPIWMQVIHAFVASITAYVIACYSPFTRVEKMLIVFGYFLFFEYATISREYALGVLGLFIFSAVFRAGPRKNYVLLALILGFVCQTTIYGAILALSLVFAMIFEAIQAPSCRQSIAPVWRQLTLVAVVVMVSVSVSVLHMRPPPDGGLVTRLNLSIRGLPSGLSMFWMSFVPIPQLTRTFWNSNIIQVPHVSLRFIGLLGLSVFCVSVLFFVRKPIALFAYVCGAAGLFFFKLFVCCPWAAPPRSWGTAPSVAAFRGHLRHDGFAFILFLICLWLASAFPEKRFPLATMERLGNWFAPFQVRVLFVFLAIHTAVGLSVSAAAFKIPFSQAQAVAGFIRSHKMDQWTIIGDDDFSVSTIAGYLGRDVYYVRGNRLGSFIIWDKNRLIDFAEPVTSFAAKIAAGLHHRVLVILNYPSDTVGQCESETASFKGAIEPYENYYLYVVEPIQKPKRTATP